MHRSSTCIIYQEAKYEVEGDLNPPPPFFFVKGVVPHESASEEDVLQRRQKGEDIKYCKKCRSIKPERAHHCRFGGVFVFIEDINSVFVTTVHANVAFTKWTTTVHGTHYVCVCI